MGFKLMASRLQLELAKAKKRIAKAVHKKIDCEDITVCYDEWNISIHAWTDHDIVASWYRVSTLTTTQVVDYIQNEA